MNRRKTSGRYPKKELSSGRRTSRRSGRRMMRTNRTTIRRGRKMKRTSRRKRTNMRKVGGRTREDALCALKDIVCDPPSPKIPRRSTLVRNERRHWSKSLEERLGSDYFNTIDILLLAGWSRSFQNDWFPHHYVDKKNTATLDYIRKFPKEVKKMKLKYDLNEKGIKAVERYRKLFQSIYVKLKGKSEAQAIKKQIDEIKTNTAKKALKALIRKFDREYQEELPLDVELAGEGDLPKLKEADEAWAKPLFKYSTHDRMEGAAKGFLYSNYGYKEAKCLENEKWSVQGDGCSNDNWDSLLKSLGGHAYRKEGYTSETFTEDHYWLKNKREDKKMEGWGVAALEKRAKEIGQFPIEDIALLPDSVLRKELEKRKLPATGKRDILEEQLKQNKTLYREDKQIPSTLINIVKSGVVNETMVQHEETMNAYTAQASNFSDWENELEVMKHFTGLPSDQNINVIDTLYNKDAQEKATTKKASSDQKEVTENIFKGYANAVCGFSGGIKTIFGKDKKLAAAEEKFEEDAKSDDGKIWADMMRLPSR